MSAIISARDLTRHFGDFVAVDHVSFDIQPGMVVGYLGPNGSGKTTTIRMLLGLLEPTEGSAIVLGYDVARQSDKVRAAAGYMSQKFALYDDLTVMENLQFYSGVYGVEEADRLEGLVAELNLTQFKHQQVNLLSTGWRQRLALATAIVHRPQLLLLDEPTSGVDPNARRAFWDLIYDLAGQGITILVTTHYMDEAEYCSHVAILNHGILLAMETPARLKQSLGGRMWEISVNHSEGEGTGVLLKILAVMETLPGVRRVSLAGDHLRAWTDAEVEQDTLSGSIALPGLQTIKVESSQPVMEDVFMSLINMAKE